MMDVCRKIVALTTVALLCCCNGKDTLLDLYPMEPIVNPEVGVLIDGNRIIHVDFDGRQQISGVTEAGIFMTTDRFRSLDFELHAWQVSDGVVTFGDGIIVHAQAAGVSFVLRYSTDDGKTWTTFGEPIVDERLLAVGSVSPVQLSVVQGGSIWVLCQQGRVGSRRALLYRVDLEQQRSALMMDKAGAMTLDFGFADSLHGWVLYGLPSEGAGRTRLLRTENGGQTWRDGAVLEGLEQPAVAAITKDDLLVYSPEGAAFRSADGGISFEPVTIGGQIIACHAASSDIVYALLENGLAKSTDGGSSWNALDAFVHGVEVSGTALDFRDERAGIVYGADRLFMTNNGGQSWELLAYPYDYVFD